MRACAWPSHLFPRKAGRVFTSPTKQVACTAHAAGDTAQLVRALALARGCGIPAFAVVGPAVALLPAAPALLPAAPSETPESTAECPESVYVAVRPLSELTLPPAAAWVLSPASPGSFVLVRREIRGLVGCPPEE
jgi:hypothetical protein